MLHFRFKISNMPLFLEVQFQEHQIWICKTEILGPTSLFVLEQLIENNYAFPETKMCHDFIIYLPLKSHKSICVFVYRIVYTG